MGESRFRSPFSLCPHRAMKKNMRTFLAILLGACTFLSLICSSTGVYAQELTLPMPLNREQKIVSSVIMEPVMNEFLNNYRPGVLGVGFMMNPMFKEGFKQELGITDEQDASLMEVFGAKFRDDPENEALKAMGQTMEGLIARINETEGDFIDISEEEKEAIQKGFASVCDKMQETAQEFFTPEQMQKVMEMEFATYGGIDSPFLQLEAIENVLDLDEEQKKLFEELQADTADEKLEVLAEITDFTRDFLSKGKLSLKDIKALEEKTKALQSKISARTREILTDEQLEKAMKIVSRQQRLMKKMMGGAGGVSSWIPGADSWRPGQPIPESMKSTQPKRAGLFPRPKPKTEAPEEATPEETENPPE